MVKYNQPSRQNSLTLMISQIHRSQTLDELRKTYLGRMPEFVDADAFGMYLFNEQQETESIFSYQANQHFLAEYEQLRKDDPLFLELLKHKQFTHSLDVFDNDNWFKQPLYSFLSRWGLKYTIEAPLICNGKIMGTLNIARADKSYFADENLIAARFLCNEINFAYQRLIERQDMVNEIRQLSHLRPVLDELPARAKEVLELAVSGYSNRCIAERLKISENTVRHHIKCLYKKLDVHNRVQLVKYACKSQAKH
ncbi:MAG: hypothetical protein HND53_03560 [Proteobacteria bacterium]|nr:hypothetical protein [Pseudomonadota bacterium]NOG59551.1 hypothetical protein [Pseudomonadota bacterium]